MIKSSTGMPTGLPDMRGDCLDGRAMVEQNSEGRRQGKGEERHPLLRDGIPHDWERCSEGGVVMGVAGWRGGCRRG